MLLPKCLVMTTPQVVRGAPILAIDYSPTGAGELGELAGPEEGEFGGWTFLHVSDGVPDDTDLYFFEQIGPPDEWVAAVIDKAEPGTYSRESDSLPFEGD